jgi:hypothetical protein
MTTGLKSDSLMPKSMKTLMKRFHFKDHCLTFDIQGLITKAPERELFAWISPNKPFEWTGRNHLTASHPKAPCLPLKGSVRRTTTKHHITDAELICLRGYDKSIVAQAQTLARLNNQKPDEVVERYLSTATAIYQQTQCVK